MSMKAHLSAVGCPDCDLDCHAEALDGVDPTVRAKLLALLAELAAEGKVVWPYLVQIMPMLIAGDWPGALLALLKLITVPAPAAS